MLVHCFLVCAMLLTLNTICYLIIWDGQLETLDILQWLRVSKCGSWTLFRTLSLIYILPKTKREST